MRSPRRSLFSSRGRERKGGRESEKSWRKKSEREPRDAEGKEREKMQLIVVSLSSFEFYLSAGLNIQPGPDKTVLFRPRAGLGKR